MGRGLYPSPDFLFLSSKKRVLVPSGTDKTYFSSAWRLDFWSAAVYRGRAIASSPPWTRHYCISNVRIKTSLSAS